MKSKEIKYYRAVLHVLFEKLDNDPNFIAFTLTQSKHYKVVDTIDYLRKVKENVSEARMEMGNSLKFLSNEESPYREASIKRMCCKSDNVPDPVDTDVNFRIPEFETRIERLDYIREILDEIRQYFYSLYEIIDQPKPVISHISSVISKLSLARNYCGKILYSVKKIRD